MPGGTVSVEVMADDAAGVLRALEIPSAHKSTWPVMDPYLRSWLLFVRWLVEVAPSERAFLEGFSSTSTRPERTTKRSSTSSLRRCSPSHKQTTEDLQHYLDAFLGHDTADRLSDIAAPARGSR
jgi:hypothetical protein